MLLADDSADAADALAELIRLSLPHDVVVVYGGLQACRAVEICRPDVAILDLHMPEVDGVEVARHIRHFYRHNPPYLIALTGWPNAAQRLTVLGNLFDRVFAKPPDLDQLLAVLSRVGSGQFLEARYPVVLDLADLFTRAARRVIPRVASRQLVYSFDYRGPSLIVEDDPVSVQSAFHRLLLGLADIMQAGFVMFNAEAAAESSGSWSLTVDAAGTGPLRPAAEIATVLRRLALDEGAGLGASPGLMSGRGICPNTGATVTYSIEPNEGVLLRAVFAYADVIEVATPQPVGGGQARAWLVDESDVPSAWLENRLQRLGWTTRRFSGCAAAVENLKPGGPVQPPALLVMVEGPYGTPACMTELQQMLPPQTQSVLAVMAGSPMLASPIGVAGCEIRVLPFSPAELDEFGAQAGASPHRRPSLTRPAALALESRLSVLLVDDNPVNRMVGRALLDALGYEVRTANDGLDAIDQCRQAPPRIVLMDLEMPVLRGIEATIRLRAQQSTGEVAPFAILAATSDDTQTARAQCAGAGMDGFLAKPLVPSELQAELRRLAAM
jgi:CheY-like chemotaxis protein